MTDLVLALLNLVFFPFSQHESILFLTVFGVWLFCLSFKCIKSLMRLGLMR